MSGKRHTSFASIVVPSLLATAFLVPGGRAARRTSSRSRWRASRWRPTSTGDPGPGVPRGTPAGRRDRPPVEGRRGAGRRGDPAAPRPARAARGRHQPRGAGQGGPRAGAGGPPAGRLHAGPGQGAQRGRGHQAPAHHQPAVGPDRRRGGRPEHDAAGPAAPEAGRGRGRGPRPLPPGRDVHEPADDGEPQRPGGRVRPRLDLQHRGREARGDDRLRRRPGDAGPRLPRRGARALRRPAGHPGQAPHPRPRRQADGRPLHVPRPLGPRLSRRSRSGWPPTCSSSSRSTATTAARSCSRRAG